MTNIPFCIILIGSGYDVLPEQFPLLNSAATHIVRIHVFEPISPAPLRAVWLSVSILLTFFKSYLGRILESNTNMMIQKGKGTYVYSTQRVNGKPVTRYIGKSSSPQAKEYADVAILFRTHGDVRHR